jgi:hypothetical protein
MNGNGRTSHLGCQEESQERTHLEITMGKAYEREAADDSNLITGYGVQYLSTTDIEASDGS